MGDKIVKYPTATARSATLVLQPKLRQENIAVVIRTNRRRPVRMNGGPTSFQIGSDRDEVERVWGGGGSGVCESQGFSEQNGDDSKRQQSAP